MSAVLTSPTHELALPERDAVVPATNGFDERWVARAIHVCEQAAKGNFEPRILHCDPSTPSGRLGRAINDLLDRADAFVRESAATLDHASQGRFYRRVLPNGMVGDYRRAADIINAATAAMADNANAIQHLEGKRQELAGELEVHVGGIVAHLAESALELRQNAQQLAGLAQSTTQAANEGLRAAAEAGQQVTQVETAGKVLSNSERAVSERVQKSHEVAHCAVRDAERMNELMKQLSEANQRIGDVVTLIANIARQTNLLSLNASIEAARAGDAGRGFAVVAMEVKKLADETAGATKRITKEISAVQSASRDTARAIAAIEGTIQSLNSLAGEIDRAVHEQIALTANIHERLHDADGQVAVAANAIERTGEAAERADATAECLLRSADLVADQTDCLRTAVERFLTHMRGR